MANETIEEAARRKLVKACCPKCYRASTLEVRVLAWAGFGPRGLTVIRQDEITSDHHRHGEARCSCGWGGTTDEIEETYARCCQLCGAPPNHIGYRDETDERYCDDCGGSQ